MILLSSNTNTFKAVHFSYFIPQQEDLACHTPVNGANNRCRPPLNHLSFMRSSPSKRSVLRQDIPHLLAPCLPSIRPTLRCCLCCILPPKIQGILQRADRFSRPAWTLGPPDVSVCDRLHRHGLGCHLFLPKFPAFEGTSYAAIFPWWFPRRSVELPGEGNWKRQLLVHVTIEHG